MADEALERQVKELIISALALEDVTADDIDAEAPLFVDGLGLDSIDALELGMAIQKRYGVRAEGSPEENRRHFSSVRHLAAFIGAAAQTKGA